MKILSNSSNVISLIPTRNVNPGNWCGEKEFKASNAEIRKEKGKIKSFLGMVYFVTLMYSLFVLLT